VVQGVHDDEEIIAEVVHFRPQRWLTAVLDRKRMKVESLLQPSQLGFVEALQIDPADFPGCWPTNIIATFGKDRRMLVKS
jgi:hypothetical protein